MPEELAKDDVLRLQQILATDTASLSLGGLAARNPDEPDSLRNHLADLRERGFVNRDDGEWSVTDHGVESLKEMGQYDQIGILYDMYTAAGNDRE